MGKFITRTLSVNTVTVSHPEHGTVTVISNNPHDVATTFAILHKVPFCDVNVLYTESTNVYRMPVKTFIEHAEIVPAKEGDKA